MTARECVACARPVPDGAPLCRWCGSELQAQLRQVPALLADLAITYARLDQLGPLEAPGRGHGETPVAWKAPARRAAEALAAVVLRWAREFAPRWGEPHPEGTGRAAAWLAGRTGSLRREPDAQACAQSISDAIRRGRAVIDLPRNRTRFPVGPCPDNPGEQPCSGQVWAYIPLDEREPAQLRCTDCGASWDTTRWRRVGDLIARRRAQLAAERKPVRP